MHASSVFVSAANCVDRSCYRMNSVPGGYYGSTYYIGTFPHGTAVLSPPSMPPPTQHNTGANGDYFQFGKYSCVDIGIL